MKKMVCLLFVLSVLSSCAAPIKESKLPDSTCKRYEPMTTSDFRIALLDAMIERAYAAYSLGYSELIILQTLKDDFQFWYINHVTGEAINSSIDAGLSCNNALRIAYANKNDNEKHFQDFALSAMKLGQKRMVEGSPDSKEHAKEVMNMHPPTAIINADKRYIEEKETINGRSRQ